MGQFYLSCLQESGIGSCPESIYGNSTNCCYTVNCKFRLSPSYPATTITAIYPDAGNTCQFDVLLINGIPFANPLAAPIVINQGDEISLQLQLCVCDATIPFQISFGLAIDTTGSLGPGTDYLYYCAETISPVDPLYAPVPISFTTLTLNPCIGTTGCDDILTTIPFTNYSSFDVPVLINDAGNFPVGTKYYVDGVLQSSNVVLVPALTSVDLGVSFCWPNSTPATFDIFIEICDVYNWRITTTIAPAFCIGCGVGCTGIDIETEAGYLPTLSAGCGYSLPSVYTESAIGEKKTILWRYTYNYGFTNADFDLYFNPILWTNVQSVGNVDPYDLAVPNIGWYIKIQGFMVASSQTYNMYQLTSPTAAQSQQNWEVQIEVPNANSLYIYFTFYMTMDVDDKITNTILDNYKRLLYQNANAPQPQIAGYNTVYSSNANFPRFLSKELFFIDNNRTDPSQPPKTRFRCFIYRTIPMSSRYYNMGLAPLGAEFIANTSDFTFSQERNLIVSSLNSFSIFDKTKVTFQINMQPGYTPSSMIAYIFSTDNTSDNSIDWQTNNELSRSNITTIGAPSVLNGEIESPSTGPTLVAGNTWKIDFFVGTGWDASKTYRVAVIVYDYTNDIVNTFISPVSVSISTVPSEDALCCPLDVDAEWSDYINTYTNVYPFVTAYKQRVENTIIVEGGLFASDCLNDLGYTGDWIRLISDIRLRVYDRRLINLPATTNDLWVNFMYYQYQSLYNSTYPNNFNNLSTDFIAEDDGFGVLTLKWNGRIRWEGNVQFPTSNVYTSFQDTEFTWAGAGGSANQYINQFGINYDWTNGPIPIDATGRIFFDYIIRFDLSSVLNLPNNQPFYVNKVIRQRLDPFGEEPITPPNVNIPDNFNPLYLEGWNGAAYIPLVGPICPGDYEHVRALLIQLAPQGGYVIGFFNRSPYGILQLKEDDETGVSPNGFTQLDSQYIYDTTPGVQVGTWEFKIDVNSLPAGTYEICAMYLPV
jgi:hypothetical protein